MDKDQHPFSRGKKEDLIARIEEYEKEISKLHTLLESEKKQNKEHTDFLTHFAHEIRLPLTLFRNSIELLKEEAGHRQLSSLPRLEKEARDLKDMVINILDYENILQGKILYDHKSVINISSIVVEKAQVCRPLFNEKDIQVILDIEHDLYIQISPHALDRILNNIIDNAVKYNSPENGRIHITLKSEKNNVFLIIKNTGTGISASCLKHIFTPVFQAPLKKKACKGIGIGLPLVKNILKEIDAAIHITSKEKEGTIVTITFKKEVTKKTDMGNYIDMIPLAKPVITGKISLKQSKYNKHKKTILIVEDHQELLFLMQQQMIEFNVYYAFDGIMALQKLNTISKPDIIISDILMENCDGYEFFNKLKNSSEYVDIPFIFITAKNALSEKIKVFECGVIDIIEKPFSIVLLNARIKALLRNRDITKKKNIEELENRILGILRAPEKKIFNYSYLYSKFKLTNREREIVQLVIGGLQNKEIAELLCISPDTVKAHIQNIKQKCQVANKVQLINLFRA